MRNASTTSGDVYEALPLRRDRLSTRLLTIRPGARHEDICCNLKVTTINANSNYEALSYTWGNAADRRPIRVNGRRSSVTVNLEEAIRQLRRLTEKRTIWADAVCINQGDMQEREQQVGEMAQIYRNASRVLIWLGKEAAWRPRHNPFHDFLEDVLQRKWWKRVWVIQEVALAASDPLVICGDCSIAWSDLLRLVRSSAAESKSSFLIQQMEAMRLEALCPPRLRDLDVQEPVPYRLEDRLYTWLLRTANFEATQAMDKVYAILHLARSSLKIDYSVSPDAFMKELVSHSINSEHNLDLLALCHPARSQEMSSWTPDITIAGLTEVPKTMSDISFLDEYILEKDRRWCLMGEDVLSNLATGGELPPEPVSFVVEGALHVRGIHLGHVAEGIRGDLGSGFCDYHDSIGERFLEFWTLSKKESDEIGRPKTDGQDHYEYRSRRDKVYQRKAQQILDHGDEGLLLELLAAKQRVEKLLPVRNNELRYFSLSRLKAAIRSHSNMRDKIDMSSKFLWWADDGFRLRQAKSLLRKRFFRLAEKCTCLGQRDTFADWVLSIYCRPSGSDYEESFRLRQIAQGRCGFSTDSGLIGIGPPGINPGDSIFIPPGSGFAYALRSDDERYRLIGPVYVSAMKIRPHSSVRFRTDDGDSDDDGIEHASDDSQDEYERRKPVMKRWSATTVGSLTERIVIV